MAAKIHRFVPSAGGAKQAFLEKTLRQLASDFVSARKSQSIKM